MGRVSTIVAAPAWGRAWSLPLWFESVRSNVDPADTGLAFVVPASDTATREAIEGLSEGFAWIEILRDRGEQSNREERPATEHRTLAMARNQLLQIAESVQPEHYISWDTDFLLPHWTVEDLKRANRPLVTVWSWLNRQPPRPTQYHDGENLTTVLYQPPVCATAMHWDTRRPMTALHYPAHEFALRAQGIWRCDVALAFQVMDPRAYRVAHYAPHPSGEDIPFNWQLEQRGIPRFCYGKQLGVHLYDRQAANETQMGWPGILQLAKQMPLAATYTEPRSPLHEIAGFFPMEHAHDSNSIAA